MEEHAREERERRRDERRWPGVGEGEDLVRDGAPAEDRGLELRLRVSEDVLARRGDVREVQRADLPQERRDVERDETDGDHRDAIDAGLILQRDHVLRPRGLML